MIVTCMSVALAAALYLSPTCSTASHSPLPLTQTLPFGKWVGVVVQKKESLKAIARLHYGDEEAWTTLWNDNPDIEDPEAVEKGTFLRIRAAKPEAEELKPELGIKKNLQPQPVFIQKTQPTPQPTSVPTMLTDEQINFLGNCEAGMNPVKNTGNGYYGAFQFSYGTWQSMNTGYERADLAPIEVQKEAVQRLVQRSSIYTQFPGCANRMRGAGLI